jgi:hypothetical protein
MHIFPEPKEGDTLKDSKSDVITSTHGFFTLYGLPPAPVPKPTIDTTIPNPNIITLSTNNPTTNPTIRSRSIHNMQTTSNDDNGDDNDDDNDVIDNDDNDDDMHIYASYLILSLYRW